MRSPHGSAPRPPSPGAGVVARNGLDNGELDVFRSQDEERSSELTLQSGTKAGEWVEIPGAELMSEAELQAASDAVGAMTSAGRGELTSTRPLRPRATPVPPSRGTGRLAPRLRARQRRPPGG